MRIGLQRKRAAGARAGGTGTLRRKTKSWAWFLGLALSLVGPAAEASELEIYRPRHRPAGELASLANDLLKPKGTAVADTATGQIILRGRRQDVDQALAALRKIDVALPSYRIEARKASQEELRARGFEVEGWVALGDVRIGRLAREDSGAQVVFHSTASLNSEDFAANLLVMEGRQGEIWTGTTHPAQVALTRGPNGPFELNEIYPQQTLRSGFAFRPRQLGDGRIELEVSAIRSQPDVTGEQRQTTATTRVQTRPGEGVVIASFRQDESGVRTSAYALHDERVFANDTWIWVRVSPEGSDPRP